MGSPSAQGAKYPEHGNPAILLMGSANGGPVVKTDSQQPLVWPAWVYCTRYSDRPSSGEYPTPGCAVTFGPADSPRTLSCRRAGESRPGLGCSLLTPAFSSSPRSQSQPGVPPVLRSWPLWPPLERLATAPGTGSSSLNPSVLHSEPLGPSLCITFIILRKHTHTHTISH